MDLSHSSGSLQITSHLSFLSDERTSSQNLGSLLPALDCKLAWGRGGSVCVNNTVTMETARECIPSIENRN